jgi:peptidoglycan/LPS O-acetylase OafA/YrhL
MGTLRTLLAIAVVFAHTWGFMFTGGQNAVQLFYMISGFLISFVLVERQAYPRLRDFYINRYLRLYPIYLVVALLTLLCFAIAWVLGQDIAFFKVWNEAPLAAQGLLIVAHAILFLQDWVMFAAVQGAQLVFASDFRQSEVVLHLGLLVPQAWTLGVELSFYLIAPFILKRRGLLIILLGLSVCLRLYLWHIGLGRIDPWTYRFFPTELALFVAGALSHQLLLPLWQRRFTTPRLDRLAVGATAILVLITLLYWRVPLADPLKSLLLLGVFFILMPLAFLFQSTHAWDRWIGELSYPIYIGHMLVVYLVTRGEGQADASFGAVASLGIVVLSIGLAILLNIWVGRPMESLRNRHRSGAPG